MNNITEIIAIDPGDIESGFCVYGYDIKSNLKILEVGIEKNENILSFLQTNGCDNKILSIEMIASYGMPVGKEVFDTCVWIGRYIQAWGFKYNLIYRREIKMHFCNSMKAKDTNIIQALVDRFGNVNKHGKYSKGTKKDPGFFYGFSDDMWSAFALAAYQKDILDNESLSRRS